MIYRKKLIEVALPPTAINAVSDCELDFAVVSVNFDLRELLERSTSPA